jgi:hypothetical protein
VGGTDPQDVLHRIGARYNPLLGRTNPTPTGLLPAVAIDGKLLHGTRTEAGQVFLVAAITHHSGAILGQR